MPQSTGDPEMNLLYQPYSEDEADRLVDIWTPDESREIQAVPVGQIVSAQEFLYDDCVTFYANALRRAMFPPVCDGLRLPDGRVFLIEGNHRTHAWMTVGFQHVPMRVQEPGLHSPAI